MGVCIPWKYAHVMTGGRDRQPWQDHLLYCQGLQKVLSQYSDSFEPICILGDYNQRIPRLNQPQKIGRALLEAIPETFTIPTKGLKDMDGKMLIDHYAVSPSLNIEITQILSRFAEDGTRLSDHVGVVAELKKVVVPPSKSELL
ncbi:MAG: hypothetical protein HC924_15630 [Synechococcaceae cyanobacterium SM2_3_2]|nr:hypothetical protein [Synechococcaceae cyanobacterium SM2_3_2]